MNASVYQRVTERIIREMEAGVLPWEKPWSDPRIVEVARNAATGRRYTGINVLLLWDAAHRQGFGCNRWLTFNQARVVAGGVRKGARGATVVFATNYVPRSERRRVEAGEITLEEAQIRFHLRTYTVFNLDQIHQVPDRLRPGVADEAPQEGFEDAERVIRGSRARIECGGDDAYYCPESDLISLPLRASFQKPDDFYATAFHELIHWTGHPKRLNRSFGTSFDDQVYIREEMIAELGAAFLGAHARVHPRSRHSDYIAFWLSALRADPCAIFVAARHASEATEYVLGLPGEAAAAA